MLRNPREGCVNIDAIREDFLKEMLPILNFEGCGKKEWQVQRHRSFKWMAIRCLLKVSAYKVRSPGERYTS